MKPIRMIMLLAFLPALLAACEQRSETVLTGHAIHTRDVAKLSIGKSTQSDVESLLGAPDERGADGSLRYEATAVRRTGRALGGWMLAADAQVVGRRSATFRFEGGVLSRICRERS